MKIKYLLPSLILCASVFVACGEEKTEKTVEPKEEETSEKVVENDGEIVDDSEELAYVEESIQSQWDDIVSQVATGDKTNLNMYLDGTAPTFSQEEWEYIDLSQEEYYATFSSYATFEELPAAHDMENGKVVQVYFETKQDGEVFESAAIIYLVEEDGLIWIVGCELVG